MVSKLAAGTTVVIVVVGGLAAAYLLTHPSDYTLTISVDPPDSGSVILEPSGETYDEGVVVTLTVIPASGYKFEYWSGDVSGTSTSVTVAMGSNKSVTAYFGPIGD